jgi:hypothetical protein
MHHSLAMNNQMNQYMQPTMMMHPGHFQHFHQQQQQFQQQQTSNANGNGMNNQVQMRQQRQSQQQQPQQQRQPGGPSLNNKRGNKKNTNTSTPTTSNNPANDPNNTTGNGAATTTATVTVVERPTLALPPAKRQRKKDIVPPLEKVTIEPTVREPLNDTERAEIEAWKAERRKHWPSMDNLARKQQEDAARQARGELVEAAEDSRKTRLQEILQRQRAMGLSKQAGTEDMLLRMNGTSGNNERGGRGGRGGRGQGHARENGERGGGGRDSNKRGGKGGRFNGPEYGYQSFIDAGEAPGIDPGLEKWRQRREEEKKEILPEKEQEHQGTIDSNGGVDRGGSDTAAGIEVREDKGAVDNVVIEEKGIEGGEKEKHAGRGRGGGARGRGGRGERTLGRGGRGRGGKDNNEFHQQQHNNNKRSHPHAHAQPSLLEKLLAKEIRQDMSYILQAFRFFIMNNFFQGHGQTDQQHQQQQQIEDQIIFPVAMAGGMAIENEMPRTDGSKPTIQDILKNKEGIDIDITDDDDEEELIEEHHHGEI